MSSNSGIFGLSGFNDKNLEGLIPDKTRESYREFGFFHAGGVDGYPYYSSIDRVDYSNDTTTSSARTNYPVQIGSAYGLVGNSSKSYIAGGRPAPDKSFIYRYNYSNDNITRVANLIVNISGVGSNGVGNEYFGYIANTRFDRIDYSNDFSTPLIRGNLSSDRRRSAATGNSNFGWITDADGTARVDRINYSNDTARVSVRGPLSVTSSSTTYAATGNNNFGYFAGAVSQIIHKIDYSNDTIVASTRSSFGSLPRQRLAATGNSNFGYFGGGDTSSFDTTSGRSTVNRLDYSNDTASSSVRGPLRKNVNGLGATSSHSFGGSPISQYGVFAKPFGYFGLDGSIQRLDFSSDTSAVRSRSSISGLATRPKASGNANYVWIGGGVFSISSAIYRFDYSNDNAGGTLRGPLSSARGYFAATGNSNFGYFSGGQDIPGPNSFTRVDRINYSNDTATASVRGALAAVMYAHTGFSTFNYGYFAGGGSGPTTKTFVYRIDYSNDNSITSARGPLQNSRRFLATSQNSNYAFVSGGDVGGVVNSIVERIDFANDSATTSIRGPLGLARRDFAGTGNQNFGYFGGGFPGPISTVDRIDYANDTATATRVNSIGSSRIDYGFAPTSFGGATDFTPTQTFFDIQSMKRIEDTTNESVKKRVLGSYGYFGGGNPGPVSIVDRIDYSNDLAAASIRGNLTKERRLLGGVGNSNFGYFVGGATPSGVAFSSVDRIDYSNDVATSSIRSPLVTDRTKNCVGNFNFGYFGGGFSLDSRIERIDYSNDLTSPLTKGRLSVEKYVMATSGNNNFGYFGGGLTSVSPQNSTIERLDYSNDSAKTLIRGSLTLPSSRFSAVGNANFGYYNVSLVSTLNRIDYSNDTQTAIERGTLVVSRGNTAATGNSNFGYFAGGTPGFSLVDRIDYSNDSSTTVLRGILSLARGEHAATTNARFS